MSFAISVISGNRTSAIFVTDSMYTSLLKMQFNTSRCQIKAKYVATPFALDNDSTSQCAPFPHYNSFSLGQNNCFKFPKSILNKQYKYSNRTVIRAG